MFDNVGENIETESTPLIDMTTIDDIVDEGDVTEALLPGAEAPSVTPPVDPDKPIVPNLEKSSFDAAKDDLLEDPEGTEGAGVIGDSPDKVFYKGVVDILKGKDFFQQDNLGEITNDSELAAALDKEIEARLTDKYKELDALAKTGAPVDEVVNLQQGLTQLEAFNEEHIAQSPEIAQQLIIEDFIQRGFSQEESVKYYDLINKGGNTTEEAMRALDARKTHYSTAITNVKNKALQDKADFKSKEEANIAALETAFEANEILGRSVGPGTTQKLKTMVHTPVAYTKSGQPMNEVMKFRFDNPVEFEQKLSYLFLVTNGFKDLKAFDRSAETRVSRGMKEAVNVLSTDGGPISRASTSGKNVIDMNSIDDIV